jgi:type IV pilus assembly protein PilN
MIRINLLPVRASKKKETAMQQLVLSGAVLAAFIVVLTLLYTTQVVKIKSAKSEIDISNKEIDRLKKVIGEIDNIKKMQDEAKKKLDILNILRKGKTGPAIRLAKLSQATPDKLWLTKYTESGTNVSMAGIGMNEDVIAGFMRNLVASDEYANVELLVSEQVEVMHEKAKKFDITCVLKVHGNEETPAKPK